MEPAGSHGVWSLDDFQFVPFLWGSSQLFGNRDEIEPSMFLLEKTVLEHGDKYMFLACIKYIMKVSGLHSTTSSPVLFLLFLCHFQVLADMLTGLFPSIHGAFNQLPILISPGWTVGPNPGGRIDFWQLWFWYLLVS